MEAIADESERGSYRFSIVEQGDISTVHFGELFSAIINDLDKGILPAIISTRFHRTVAQVVAQMCKHLSHRTAIKKIALSGGVFQNRLLFRLTVTALEALGLEVLTHRDVPANDGGISLGQAVIANFVKGGC